MYNKRVDTGVYGQVNDHTEVLKYLYTHLAIKHTVFLLSEVSVSSVSEVSVK